MRARFETPNAFALSKDSMVVDMHFHSKYSHDSSTPIESIVRNARQFGVGVALTDHNSIQGVLAASRIAPKTVHPGIEICTKEGKDIIPYFYSVAELEAFFGRVVRPQLKRKTSLQSNRTGLSAAVLLSELRRENCVVALPHPFAVLPRNSYAFFNARRNRHLLSEIDAVEVLNATMLHKQNLTAVGWAMQHEKAFVGGSDGHTVGALGSVFTVAHAQTWEEFLDMVRKRQADVVGVEHKLRRHVLNATRMYFEKARLIKNYRNGRRMG